MGLRDPYNLCHVPNDTHWIDTAMAVVDWFSIMFKSNRYTYTYRYTTINAKIWQIAAMQIAPMMRIYYVGTIDST